MVEGTLVSYGQNNEDVVLWRALREVPAGRYVEVGANEPSLHSVSRSFYDRGWSGLTIDPVPEFVEMHRRERPRDRQVQAAVTSAETDHITLHVFPGTGLSTLVDDVSSHHEATGRQVEELVVPAARLDALLEETGWGHNDIQFLLVDVEGAEAEVLESIDLAVWRPWVLVIEGVAPLSSEQTHAIWEPSVLAAGYEFCLFDGVSRFYVAKERAELRPRLTYPACALDDFISAREFQRVEEVTQLEAQRADLTRQLLHWRSAAIRSWGTAVSAKVMEEKLKAARARTERVRKRAAVLKERAAAAQDRVAAIEGSTSWKVTAPLRRITGLAGRRR